MVSSSSSEKQNEITVRLTVINYVLEDFKYCNGYMNGYGEVKSCRRKTKKR